MSKAVLISIRPEWCEKIINGRKTIEVRKTRPKMNTPFKCYIYECGNGKVIGEFLCDEIININGAGRIPSDAARPTCLEPAELHQYLGAATGFGWHISNLIALEAETTQIIDGCCTACGELMDCIEAADYKFCPYCAKRIV